MWWLTHNQKTQHDLVMTSRPTELGIAILGTCSCGAEFDIRVRRVAELLVASTGDFVIGHLPVRGTSYYFFGWPERCPAVALVDGEFEQECV